MDKAAYKIEEVAEMLSMHLNTVRNMIDRGELQKITIGKSVRITQHELNNYLKRKSGRYVSPDLFDNIINAWNEICGEKGKMKPVMGIKTDTIKKFKDIVSINKELRKIDTWRAAFEFIANNSFLNGTQRDSVFTCNLNWLIEKEKIIDVINGQYNADGSGKDLFKGVKYE